jgi:hypothetical protein
MFDFLSILFFSCLFLVIVLDVKGEVESNEGFEKRK